MIKLIKFYSPFIPLLGLLIIGWYSFGSKHPNEYCVNNDNTSLIVGLVQFFALLVVMMEFNIM